MDRAAKVKIYRKTARKIKKKQHVQQYGAGIGILAFVTAAVLVFALRGWKENAEMTHVTYAELASLMSFFIDDEMEQKLYQDAAKIVTPSDVKDLVQKVGLSGAVMVDGGSGELDRESMMNYYDEILDYLDLDGEVGKQTVLFLKETGSTWLTSIGTLNINQGIVKPQPYSTYEVYILKETVLGIRTESAASIKLEDVIVSSFSDKQLRFQYQDESLEMDMKEDAAEKPAENALCTLTVSKGEVTKVQVHQIAVQEEDAQEMTAAKSVRVLLLNSGNIHYDEIYLTCDQDFKVNKSKKTTNYKKLDVLNIKKLKIKTGEYAVVTPSKSSGQLFLSDKTGSAQSKGYYGNMSIYRDKEGYYIVNKVNIEKYLYSVVASEMPASFEPEALKAQAVCARSYVYRQMESGDYSDYHAHIDDSTNYQVYNKSDVNDAGINAVKETSGMVMYDENKEIVNAYYFSSSCGYSSGMEIWNQQGVYPYLKAKSLIADEKSFDLSSEKAFRTYIKNEDVEAYDSHSRYFRWNTALEMSSSLKQFKQLIQERRKINTKNIGYFTTVNGKTKRVNSMKGFGGVENIECTSRSKSGAILELTVTFEYGVVKIKSEYNIRYILGCAMEKITYMDGTENMASRFLPSAYVSISFHEKSGRFLLTGGGNGHGMGMSQYGADGMAKQGWDYKKILKFYYDGIKIGTVS